MRTIVILLLFCVCTFSCKKKPGEGGFATIQGKVYVKNYDSFFTNVTSEYYLPSENVYIIYGDGTEIGKNVKTSYDGSFKFDYLRKGTYKVYVIGKDSTSSPKGNPIEVLVKIEITQKKQLTTLPDLVILK